MPEATLEQPTTSTGTESLGWRAGLPDDLKQNTDIANYKTVGDFTKDALSWKGKVSELEGKLGDSIPKLPDDATDEERELYLDALGRPSEAREYEFDGEDKNDPDWTNGWKTEFHNNGLTKVQAKNITAAFNKRGQEYMAKQKAIRDAEYAKAEQTFRAEMGDKFDSNVELAKRVTKQHLGEEFDVLFERADPDVRLNTIRIILKMAALTGEDTSPQGAQPSRSGEVKPEDGWMNIYKHPKGR